MAKKDRCGRVKRSDALVVWDDPHNPKGNVQKVLAHGLATIPFVLAQPASL